MNEAKIDLKFFVSQMESRKSAENCSQTKFWGSKNFWFRIIVA